MKWLCLCKDLLDHMCRDYSLRRFCEEWRIWIRPILILTYGIFAIIVVPLLIVNTVKDGFTRLDQLILIGGLFVLSAVPVSVWHITQHVIHFTKPILQKHIIRILWMVPIYALNAVSFFIAFNLLGFFMRLTRFYCSSGLVCSFRPIRCTWTR